MKRPLILCVDDEKMVLDSLRRQLSQELGNEYTLEFAESGFEALDIVRECLGDGVGLAVVVADQLMPEMQGDQLLVHIHQMSPATKKIMLTGQGGVDSIIASINQANLYRYLVKPWDKADVLLTIREAAKSYLQEKTLQLQNERLRQMYAELQEMNANLADMVAFRTQALHIQEAFYERLFTNSPEAIIVLDRDGCVSRVNQAFEALFQYPTEKLIGEFLAEKPWSSESVEQRREYLQRLLAGETLRLESLCCRQDGSWLDVAMTGYPVTAEGRVVAICLIFSDISQRKRVEEQMRRLSLHDALTGVYNRTYFEQEMQRVAAMRDMAVGVIVCDLDGLKMVNDNMGHEAGDRLIQSAATVLKESFRSHDVVARIGGDEFAVLLVGADVALLQECQRRIGFLVNQRNALSRDLYLGISVGWALKEPQNNSLAATFKEADAAMYRDKALRARSALGEVNR